MIGLLDDATQIAARTGPMAIGPVPRFIQHLPNNPEHHRSLRDKTRAAFDQRYNDTAVLTFFAQLLES